MVTGLIIIGCVGAWVLSWALSRHAAGSIAEIRKLRRPGGWLRWSLVAVAIVASAVQAVGRM